jgi:hypothetical protein
MLRKTMIVSAKAAALTSGLIVEAFAHGGDRGHSWVRAADGCVSWLHRHRKPPLCSTGGCSRLRRRSTPLFRDDMPEEGCKLMATLAVVVNSRGNFEAVLQAASALAKRYVDHGVRAADYTPVGAALLRTLNQGLSLG